MKWRTVFLFLFVSLTFSCLQNREGNKKISSVYDNEEILTSDQEKYLNSVISHYERKTGKEIFILTSKDLGEVDDARRYAADFENTHVVDKEKDKGLVIFVSKNLSQAALSTGFGTDSTLKNETCRKIVDSSMIPLFKQDKYFDGLKAGLDECIKNWK
jgi:uncharacterized protein